MFNNGRDPAHTCACCGQEIRSSGSLTLQVEEIVLDLCNQAFAEAEAHGHAHVDVAHLIAILTGTPAALTVFWQLNLDPAAMAAAAARWLARMERRNGTTDLTASAELKTLLTRAQDCAARDGRTHASLADLIRILADLSASAPDSIARSPRPPVPAALGHSLHDWLTTSPPGPARGTAPVSNTQHHRSATAAENTNLAALLARLDRQEAELAELRKALKSTASARASTSHSTSARSTSRGQTYVPGIHVLTTQSTSDRIYLRRCVRQRQDQTRRRRNRLRNRQAAADRERQSENASSRSWTHRRSDSRTEKRSAAGQNRDRAFTASDIERDDDTGSGDTAKRFYLALDDHIERAPSIGPKTAGRLVDAGVATVREFLAADPDALSGAVRAKFITAQRVRDWQAQTRLVCTVPFLRGTHAQLLVGAGYPTLEAVIAADPSILCAAILKFAATRDGQSVLRAGPPPEMERILRWLQNAADAEPARAAA